MLDITGKPAVRRTVFYAYVLSVLALAVYPLRETVASNDKVNHALAFIAFYGLAVWSHQRARNAAVFMWGIAYGALIEIIQSFIPYRQCSLGDLAADAAGLMAGMAAWSLYRRWLGRNGPEPERLPVETRRYWQARSPRDGTPKGGK